MSPFSDSVIRDIGAALEGAERIALEEGIVEDRGNGMVGIDPRFSALWESRAKAMGSVSMSLVEVLRQYVGRSCHGWTETALLLVVRRIVDGTEVGRNMDREMQEMGCMNSDGSFLSMMVSKKGDDVAREIRGDVEGDAK